MGGVDLTNLASFIKAGAVAVGAGGSLLDKNIIAARYLPRLTALAKQYVVSIAKRQGATKTATVPIKQRSVKLKTRTMIHR